MSKILFLLIGLTQFLIIGYGQTTDRYIGIGFGPVAYKGDLNHTYSKFQSAFRFTYFKETEKRIQSTFHLSIGKINAGNKNYQFAAPADNEPTPNTSFETPFQTLFYQIRIRFLKDKKLVPYFGTGAGLFRYTPKDNNGDVLSEKDNTRASGESYSTITISLPIELGATVNISKLKLGIGVTWANPLTDYLDNIKDWGDKKGNDHLLMYTVSLHVPLRFLTKTNLPAE